MGNLGIVGLKTADPEMSEWFTDLAFDVLALEALFMVPRVCSVLSLSPYWGVSSRRSIWEGLHLTK
jgi:hypothetical protein